MDKSTNLLFMTALMQREHVTPIILAERLGQTPGNINAHLCSGDCKISILRNMCHAMGYELQLRLKTGNNIIDNELDTIILNGCSIIEPNRNLAYIKTQLEMMKIGNVEIAQKMGLTRPGVARWWQVDDCYISYLYLMCEKFGWTLIKYLEPLGCN